MVGNIIEIMPGIKIVDYSEKGDDDNSKIQKRRTKGSGSIRKKGNTYEGRVTVKIKGKSKQVSRCDPDKKTLIKKMAQLISEADDYKYIKRNVMTISEWL